MGGIHADECLARQRPAPGKLYRLFCLFARTLRRTSSAGHRTKSVAESARINKIVDIISDRKFMMVGRRWDLDWNQPLDFSQPGWAESMRTNALRANVQRPGNYIDYFVYSRGLCDGLLPLAIGRSPSQSPRE